MQERNEKCACGSGIKHKKCCGRFSIHELCSKLTEFASTNRRKDRLIAKALKMLASVPATEHVVLCLVNPKPTADGFIEWSVVGVGTPADEQEALITRRVLAGCLPIGCMKKKETWRAIIDKTSVPEEFQAVYVAFAQIEMQFIAATMDGKMDKRDSELLPVPWSDRSYPGAPVKQRKPGVIKIEANIENRNVRVIVEPLNSYLDMPIDDDVVEGRPVEDALFVAEHVIAAMEQVGSSKGAVPGDVFEIFLCQPGASPRLLACRDCSLAPKGLTGLFCMGSAV